MVEIEIFLNLDKAIFIRSYLIFLSIISFLSGLCGDKTIHTFSISDLLITSFAIFICAL